MKKGTENHPKTHDLANRLKVNRAWACGILELIWGFTRDFAPQGDIGRFDDEAIARAALWQKDAGTFVANLVGSKWLDKSDTFRLIVHDWPEHCDEYTKKKLKRSGLEFASCLEMSGQNPPLSGNVRHTRARLNQTIPNLTKPNHEPDDFFQTLISRHPKKSAPNYAETEYAKILSESQDPESIAAQIDAAHRRWCEYWAAAEIKPQFLPKLMDWLKGGDWTQDPPTPPDSEPEYPKPLM